MLHHEMQLVRSQACDGAVQPFSPSMEQRVATQSPFAVHMSNARQKKTALQDHQIRVEMTNVTDHAEAYTQVTGAKQPPYGLKSRPKTQANENQSHPRPWYNNPGASTFFVSTKNKHNPTDRSETAVKTQSNLKDEPHQSKSPDMMSFKQLDEKGAGSILRTGNSHGSAMSRRISTKHSRKETSKSVSSQHSLYSILKSSSDSCDNLQANSLDEYVEPETQSQKKWRRKQGNLPQVPLVEKPIEEQKDWKFFKKLLHNKYKHANAQHNT